MTKKVVGIDELLHMLSDIQESVQPKIVAQAARSAMLPMLRQARALAPEGDETHRTYKGRLVAPGFLKRNIRLRKMKFKDKNRVGYSLAARGEAFYGKILEVGFKPAKSGKKIAGRPWLGKAEAMTADDVDKSFRAELLKRIERAKR